MKTTLTHEQSATLIARGISAKKASAVDDIRTVIDGVPTFSPGTKPIFTLTDILSLLPKKITLESGINACLEIFMADDDYCVTRYTLYTNVPIITIGPCEPIDSLYRTLLWAIDHNHVKLD